MATIGQNTMAIMKEDGVRDLRDTYGLKCASQFAKALYLEREAGHTTPEAWECLLSAIELEQEGNK